MSDEMEKAAEEYRELSERAESAPDSTGIIDIEPSPEPQPNLHVPVTGEGHVTHE
jgi:hypothetical protein